MIVQDIAGNILSVNVTEHLYDPVAEALVKEIADKTTATSKRNEEVIVCFKCGNDVPIKPKPTPKKFDFNL